MHKLEARLPNSTALKEFIRKRRSLHLATFVAFEPDVRNAYWNYLFRRRQMLAELLNRRPPATFLYFEGTNLCNADCVFCGYSQMKRPKLTMSMDLFRGAVDQYIEMGGTSIGFTPIVGDPFLDRRLFDRLDYIEERPETITIVGFYTNAIALTERKLDRLLQYRKTRINLNISFGGYDRETFKNIMGVDQFPRVQRHILHLLDRLEGGSYGNFTFGLDYRCPERYESDPFYKRINESIDKGWVYTRTVDLAFDSFGGYATEDRLASAAQGLKSRLGDPKLGPCDKLFTKPIVLADGRVNACAERDLEATLVIGDLKEQSLREILQGERRNELIRQFVHRENLPAVCNACTAYASVYGESSKAWTATAT